jgi:hypothetical protein
MLSPDLLPQLAQDRQQDLRASAAARRLTAPVPTRTRVAQSLRRAADRLDATGAAGPRPDRGAWNLVER